MDLKTHFADFTRNTHLIELIIKQSGAFQSQKYINMGDVNDYEFFKSASLQMAYNDIRRARMFGGDCLRLIVLEDEDRTFIPSDYGATYDKNLWIEITFQRDEKILIKEIKNLLQEIFNKAVDKSHITMQYLPFDTFQNEFKLCQQGFLFNLKTADQNLGLRLGELA